MKFPTRRVVGPLKTDEAKRAEIIILKMQIKTFTKKKKKHPAILTKLHKFTFLVISYFHTKFLHVGSSNLLNYVREKF